MRAWLPLAGGLALLGFLGSSAHTDITAHLFGFLAGAVLGLFYTLRFKGKATIVRQRYGAVIFWAILSLAWITAFAQR